MGKIIETNIRLTQDNEVTSFQSRVINYDSWEEYVDLYNNNTVKSVNAELGGMGNIIPAAKVLNLQIDNTKGYFSKVNRLSCNFELFDGSMVKRLAEYLETDDNK